MTAHDATLQAILIIQHLISDDAPVTGSDTKTTLIVTSGVVISAALGAIAVIYQKHRDTGPPVPPAPIIPIHDESAIERELRRQITSLSEQLREVNNKSRRQAREIERLEDQFWERGINPHTNLNVRPMPSGEQS